MESVTNLDLVHCPACRLERRVVGDYLCSACWDQLPDETRARLHDRAGGASDAYRRLLEHCRDRKPLHELVLE